MSDLSGMGVWNILGAYFLCNYVAVPWNCQLLTQCAISLVIALHDDDISRNNAVVALITLGEGWHNLHHAFPFSVGMALPWSTAK